MRTAENRNFEHTRPKRRFVDERIISEVTGRGVRTLQKDRLLGTGPFPFYRINRQVVYDMDECLAIVESTRVDPRGAID
jgi:hypothetical protein